MNIILLYIMYINIYYIIYINYIIILLYHNKLEYHLWYSNFYHRIKIKIKPLLQLTFKLINNIIASSKKLRVHTLKAWDIKEKIAIIKN